MDDRPLDRLQLVLQLVNLDQPVPQVLAGLAASGCDCDEPLCELTSTHMRHVLQRFVAQRLSAEEAEQWADAVECRDDIAYESSSAVGTVLFELANPALTQPLDLVRAQQLLGFLSDPA
jgi:hypothetical protein